MIVQTELNQIALNIREFVQRHYKGEDKPLKESRTEKSVMPEMGVV